MIDDEEIDEEAGIEFADTSPETLSSPNGEVFFLHGLTVFCEAHQAKAVQVTEDGGVWIFPAAGGKPVQLGDWKPTPDATVTTLKRVQ